MLKTTLPGFHSSVAGQGPCLTLGMPRTPSLNPSFSPTPSLPPQDEELAGLRSSLSVLDAQSEARSLQIDELTSSVAQLKDQNTLLRAQISTGGAARFRLSGQGWFWSLSVEYS